MEKRTRIHRRQQRYTFLLGNRGAKSVFRSNDYGLGQVKRPVRIKGLEVCSKAGVVDVTAIAIARIAMAFDWTL